MKFTLIILLILLSCQNQIKPDINNDIKSYIENISDSLHLAGLSVGYINQNGDRKVFNHGFSDIDKKNKISDNSIFQITSPAKTLTMFAILRLEYDGKLKLNDKLIDFLPNQEYSDPKIKDITIKHILNHQSGLISVKNYKWDPTLNKTSFDYNISQLKETKLKFKPGQGFGYSSYAYDLLMAVIEKSGGLSFENYMKLNVYKKLNMKNTNSDFVDLNDANLVGSYSDSSKQHLVFPYNRDHLASSVVMSTTNDILNFLDFFNSKEPGLLHESELINIFKGRIQTGWGSEISKEIGYSFFLGKYKNSISAIHTGGRSGFRSSFFMLTEKGISVVVLANTNNTPVNEISQFVVNKLLTTKKK